MTTFCKAEPSCCREARYRTTQALLEVFLSSHGLAIAFIYFFLSSSQSLLSTSFPGGKTPSPVDTLWPVYPLRWLYGEILMTIQANSFFFLLWNLKICLRNWENKNVHHLSQVVWGSCCLPGIVSASTSLPIPLSSKFY